MRQFTIAQVQILPDVQKYLAASVKKGRQGNPALNRPSQQPLPTGSRWLGAIPTLLHRRVAGMMRAVCPPTTLPDPAVPSSPAELAPSAGSVGRRVPAAGLSSLQSWCCTAPTLLCHGTTSTSSSEPLQAARQCSSGWEVVERGERLVQFLLHQLGSRHK